MKPTQGTLYLREPIPGFSNEIAGTVYSENGEYYIELANEHDEGPVDKIDLQVPAWNVVGFVPKKV